MKHDRVLKKDGDVLKKRRGVSVQTSGRFKKNVGAFIKNAGVNRVKGCGVVVPLYVSAYKN